jgi:hypothetical protein
MNHAAKIILSVMQNKKTGLFQKDLPTVAAGGPMDEIGRIAKPVAQAVGWAVGPTSGAIGEAVNDLGDMVYRSMSGGPDQ